MVNISFEDKIFCFTGKLAELKRTQAERETRARGGLTQKVINKDLDYLIIGSIASSGWKHGSYGTKIEKARQLISGKSKLKLISEKDFMIALENFIAVDSGEIDEKILICRYSALVKNGEFDIKSLEEYLELLKETPNSHVSAIIEEPYIYQDLYNEFDEEEIEDLLIFNTRIVKHFPLEENCQDFVDTVAKGFEAIEGLDGDLSWSEKKEGSASYAKLINEIPQKIILK